MKYAHLKALIDWFPDRKGLASGLVIAGFGSGALFFTPMMNMFTSKFRSVRLMVRPGEIILRL